MISWTQSCPRRQVSVSRKSFHVCTDDRDDCLSTGVSDPCDVLNVFCGLLFFWLHKVVDLIIQILDMDIEFIQMSKELLHHPSLQRGHDPIEIINDLFLACFEVMRNYFFLIHLIIFFTIDRFSCDQVFQNASRAFAIDVRNGAGQFDICTFQHLLKTIQFPGTLADKALAITDKFS